MNFKKLQYFISAADHQSFSQAARKFHITPGAVSQQITTLESALKCRLFEADGKNMVLTSQGQIFYESTRRLIKDHDHAANRALQIHNRKHHTLRIGLYGLVYVGQLTTPIQMLKTQFPDTEILIERCSAKPLYEFREHPDYDMVICCQSQSPCNTIGSQLLGIYPGLVYLPAEHPLSRQDTLSSEDLRNGDDNIYTSSFHEPLLSTRMKIASNRIKTLPDMDLLTITACVNQGIAVATALELAQFQTYNMIPREIKDIHLSFEYRVFFSKTNTNPMLGRFLALLVKYNF